MILLECVEFVLRIWNKQGPEPKILLEMNVPIQDLDYIAPLKPINTLNNLFNESILQSIFNVFHHVPCDCRLFPLTLFFSK